VAYLSEWSLLAETVHDAGLRMSIYARYEHPFDGSWDINNRTCSDEQVRHAIRFHVSDRLPSSTRDRRHLGLGSRAFSEGRSRLVISTALIF